jgi:hypothetical protein
VKFDGLIARVKLVINSCKDLIGKPEGKRRLGAIGVDGKIILKLLLKVYEYGVRVWTSFLCLRLWTSGRLI